MPRFFIEISPLPPPNLLIFTGIKRQKLANLPILAGSKGFLQTLYWQ
jgi:hypothetical protein